MSDKLTEQNVIAALNRYLRAWESVGVHLDVRFQMGSRSQGVAYSIEPKDGSTAPGTTNGHVGLTRREAWDTMLCIARTIEDLNFRKTLQSEGLDETSETSYFKDSEGQVVGYELG